MKPTKPIKIQEYLTPIGRSPFGEWLSQLTDSRAKAKVFVRLDRVATGNWGDHKYLSNGIYELRIPYGKGLRIYYGIVNDTLILLLGGDKSTQSQDINQAIKYWQEYQQE